MGRKKRVQKRKDGGNGQTSISISTPPAVDKIDGNIGNTGKGIDRGESSNSNAQVQVDTSQVEAQDSDDKEEEEEGPINNLPPEILTKILNLVNTRTLITCRVVSRRWSAISTAIFRTRIPVIPIWFLWEEEMFSQKDGRSLKEFVECAKKSSQENGPFVSFWFDTQGPKCFENKDFLEFLSLFSSRRLKYVKLTATYRTAQFPVVVEKLRRFLLNDVPQLEELHLELSTDWLSLQPKESKQIRLFPITKNKNTDTDEDKAPLPLPLPVEFQLPNLKLLHLDSWTILPHLQIAKDLLNAAVNLTRIKTTVMRPEHFEFFHSLGKLHLLKDLVLCFNDDFIRDMKKEKFQLQLQNWSLTSFPRFQLEKLHLLNNVECAEFDQTCLCRVSKWVSTLLEFSKDSLKELKFCALPFLPHLQLPVFKRLRTLDINAEEGHQLFPGGARTKDLFPAVNSLELSVKSWSLAFPQPISTIPRLPSVKTLMVKEWDFKLEQTEAAVLVLNLLCPNLTKLVVKKSEEEWRPPELNFPEVGRSIWTLMKEIESLEVDVDLDKLENNSLALDSCFSGIAQDRCLHLLKLTAAKQFLEDNGIPVEIPESKLTAERCYPSILNMKNLTNLTINAYLGNTLLDKKEFFSSKLTWISHKLAFNLMPHLKLNDPDFY